MTNTLASTISHNSSADYYTKKFQRYKAHHEKCTIKFTLDNLESYIVPFSMAELRTALHIAHDSAAGPDNIHYQMLMHLPEKAPSTLLWVFNDLWLSGEFQKVGRLLQSSPSPNRERPNFCQQLLPIALTSCVCKTFERMVNERLV